MDFSVTRPASNAPQAATVPTGHPQHSAVQAVTQDLAQVKAAKAPAPVQADHQPTMQHVAETLQKLLNSTRRDVEFRVDSDAHATVVTVRNANTGEVVRQFPNEEALRMMRRLNEASATLVDLTA